MREEERPRELIRPNAQGQKNRGWGKIRLGPRHSGAPMHGLNANAKTVKLPSQRGYLIQDIVDSFRTSDDLIHPLIISKPTRPASDLSCLFRIVVGAPAQGQRLPM